MSEANYKTDGAETGYGRTEEGLRFACEIERYKDRGAGTVRCQWVYEVNLEWLNVLEFQNQVRSPSALSETIGTYGFKP
jgi:hypothetical protein